MTSFARHLGLVLVAVALASASVSGCGKKSSDPPEPAAAASPEGSVTERNGPVEIAWSVSPEGQVTGKVRHSDDSPIERAVLGSLTVKPPGGAPTTLPLTWDNGALTGQIPKLDADLTEVAYDLVVDGADVHGAMHLPRGGTKELVESAKEAAAAKAIPPDTKGPNGGVVQVVGDDIVEVVADKNSGAVRMYVLGDDLKPVPVGKRRGKLAFVAATPEIVELSADPSGMFLAGKCVGKAPPTKITIVIVDGDEVDVALCHYVPGGVVFVGPAAPVFAVFIVTSWPVVVVTPPVIVVPVHKGKGKGKFKIKGW